MRSTQGVKLDQGAPPDRDATEAPAPRRTSNLREQAARIGRHINFLGIAFLVVLVGLWQAGSSAGVVPSSTFPSPASVITQTVDLIRAGTFLPAVGHTLLATLVGWAIGVAVGLALGVWLGLSVQAWRNSMLTIEVLRAVPPITLVPLLLLILGFSLNSEFALSAYGAVFPVIVYTIAGVRRCSPAHADVAIMMGISRMAWIRKVVFPSAFASIIVGLRIGMGMALGLSLVSEILGNPSGIGYEIGLQQTSLNLPALFSFVLVTGALGWLLNEGILGIARTVFPHLMRHAGEETALWLPTPLSRVG